MTIEKPFYQTPQHETDPGYIDPKEMEDIFKQLGVSEMVKLNPGAFDYYMQKYYKYLHSPGDTSLSFRDFVFEYFGEDLDEKKKGGLVK
tara:strand:- start:1293 stop:1559 length:267 start_codon:yes stop_codon:yes gene_type:complete